MLILVDEKEIECLSLSEKPLFLLKKLQSLWLHHYRSRNEAGVGGAVQRERARESAISFYHAPFWVELGEFR